MQENVGRSSWTGIKKEKRFIVMNRLLYLFGKFILLYSFLPQPKPCRSFHKQ